MECTNCRFQNMPGSAACGRCGTSLGLATATIDVHPPRAGRLAKAARRALPAGRAFYAVRNEADRFGAQAIRRATPELRVLLRLIVPGWSHFYVGQRIRGHLFLWGFLFCLLGGAIMFGTTMGSLLLGLAFSVHSSAALDIVMRDSPQATVSQRMAQSVLVSIALGALIYYPVWRLVQRVAEPHTVERSSGPFAEGDVIMVRPRDKIEVGKVVLYDIPEYRAALMGTGGHGQVVRFAGQRIDRVLAGPGDHAQWKDGGLLVNGVASPLLPLVPERMPKGLDIEVPEGSFLILPTTDPYYIPADVRGVYKDLSIIRADQIHGRVFARTHPLTRWQRF